MPEGLHKANGATMSYTLISLFYCNPTKARDRSLNWLLKDLQHVSLSIVRITFRSNMTATAAQLWSGCRVLSRYLTIDTISVSSRRTPQVYRLVLFAQSFRLSGSSSTLNAWSIYSIRASCPDHVRTRHCLDVR